MARNHVLRWRRKVGRSRLVFLPELEVELSQAFEDLESELTERRQALEQCVNSLGEHARGLLSLRYEEGLSLQEIAQRQSKTLNAVNKALGKIRALLMKCTQSALGTL